MGPIPRHGGNLALGSRVIRFTDRQTTLLSADLFGHLWTLARNGDEELTEKQDGLQSREVRLLG